MADLSTLFRRAADANSLTQTSLEFIIRDPENITTKGWPREKRIKSGVEKKSKKSPNKISDDPSIKRKGNRLAKR